MDLKIVCDCIFLIQVIRLFELFFQLLVGNLILYFVRNCGKYAIRKMKNNVLLNS